MSFQLPELDRKATQRAVESALEKYRIYRYLTYEDTETSVTASFDDIGGGNSNLPGNPTESAAIKNVDDQRYRRKYCFSIERAVSRLPKIERFLIETRYLSSDSEYITDYNVYCFEFNPPISAVTYATIRWKAFYKIALSLNIAVVKDE